MANRTFARQKLALAISVYKRINKYSNAVRKPITSALNKITLCGAHNHKIIMHVHMHADAIVTFVVYQVNAWSYRRNGRYGNHAFQSQMKEAQFKIFLLL